MSDKPLCVCGKTACGIAATPEPADSFAALH